MNVLCLRVKGPKNKALVFCILLIRSIYLIYINFIYLFLWNYYYLRNSTMLIKSRMHSKNIYKNPPNFRELAVEFEEFRKYVKNDLSGKVTIDFQDPKAVRALTKTLLKKDFDLDVEILESRLIPRIPLSLNYILWIEDLLETLSLETQPQGIDIGTGCVCVYSLLAARKGWKMLATELDFENFKQAEHNVRQNKLENNISVKLVNDSNNLLIGVINKDTKYDFCMCNPPFFKNKEKPQNRTSKRHFLETVASEIHTEISVEGGEVSFISKLIQESMILKDQIKIYTTLVGKKSDLGQLKREIQKVSPKSVAVTEFGQGRTVRWGLAWSFLDIDLKKSMPDNKKTKKKKLKSLLHNIPNTENVSLNDIFEDVKKVLTKLKIEFSESCDEKFALEFKAYQNTWSNQRKKKRQQAKTGNAEGGEEAESSGAVDDSEDCSKAKRPKLNDSADTADKSVIVEGLIFVRDEESVVFGMLWVSGDKEALHQIFQYFKNYWNNT